MLGPLLFIKDLETVVTNVECMKKFADDTKLGQTVQKEEDWANIQEAKDALMAWSSTTWGGWNSTCPSAR